jgi:hypothetical protein
MKKRLVKDFNAIFEQELPELEKVRQGFEWVTGWYLEESQREQEVLQALGDREGLVKEQIKASTIQHARSIFGDCYLRATGRKAWDDEN